MEKKELDISNPKTGNTTTEEASQLLFNVTKTNCVLCNKPYNGYGNNAQPVKDGRCCNDCNSKIIIPARIKNIMNKDVQ